MWAVIQPFLLALSQIQIMLRLLRPTRVLFSSYKPLRPLQPSGETILFNRQLRTPLTRSLVYLPAFLSYLNNIVAGFTLLNTSFLFSLMLGGCMLNRYLIVNRSMQVYTITTDPKFQILRFYVEPTDYTVLWARKQDGFRLPSLDVGVKELMEFMGEDAEKQKEFKELQEKAVQIIVPVQKETVQDTEVPLQIPLMENTEKKHEDYLLAVLTGRKVLLK